MQDAQLIGAIIGLARATEGNEHLITADTTAVILDVLAGRGSPDALMTRIEEEKRSMVPNCYTCATPCGRTSAYDMARLDAEEPDIRTEKLSLLADIRALARRGEPNAEETALLYKALIILGIDCYPADALAGLWRSLEPDM